MNRRQLEIWGSAATAEPLSEDPAYLTEQLITYIGNKRALLPFIGEAVDRVRRMTGSERLTFLDAFAGSGAVSRYFKQYAHRVVSNDLEEYAWVNGQCYLANRSDIDEAELRSVHRAVLERASAEPVLDGMFRRLYAPKDDQNIQPGERVFYTVKNAQRLDTLRTAIAGVAAEWRPFVLAPLIAMASVHANTSGVFKGFYKNRETGIGCFGGAAGDALTRILGEITLRHPVFSRFSCEWEMHCRDAGDLVRELEPVDVAYFDPPYNQHPYGSNYFMLNLLCRYEEPAEVSAVSGIPTDWKRSAYNKARQAEQAMADLVKHTRARFILVSYNDEGFIKPNVMRDVLEERGRVERFDRQYNTFRGSRNLKGRSIHVNEQLFLVDCR